MKEIEDYDLVDIENFEFAKKVFEKEEGRPPNMDTTNDMNIVAILEAGIRQSRLKYINSIQNEILANKLPPHTTYKMNNGWMAEVKYNHKLVDVGYQKKTIYDYYTTTECDTEFDARKNLYLHLIEKGLISE